MAKRRMSVHCLALHWLPNDWKDWHNSLSSFSDRVEREFTNLPCHQKAKLDQVQVPPYTLYSCIYPLKLSLHSLLPTKFSRNFTQQNPFCKLCSWCFFRSIMGFCTRLCTLKNLGGASNASKLSGLSWETLDWKWIGKFETNKLHRWLLWLVQ